MAIDAVPPLDDLTAFPKRTFDAQLGEHRLERIARVADGVQSKLRKCQTIKDANMKCKPNCLVAQGTVPAILNNTGLDAMSAEDVATDEQFGWPDWVEADGAG